MSYELDIAAVAPPAIALGLDLSQPALAVTMTSAIILTLIRIDSHFELGIAASIKRLFITLKKIIFR